MTMVDTLERYEIPFFVPVYPPVSYGEWRITRAANVLTKGYWSPVRLCEGLTALLRGEDTWMSMSPVEIESQEIGIRLASGHVAIFGMGMGWAAAATAMEPQVTAVTIVERDPDVLALHQELDVFSQLPPEARAKIRIVECDALDWKPDTPVDTLVPDIWLYLVSDGRVAEVRQMQSNVQAGKIYFWGQELEIARHAVAAGRALDAEGVAATIADFELPLLGPEVPDYAARVENAARQWMQGRWLPGTSAPF